MLKFKKRRQLNFFRLTQKIIYRSLDVIRSVQIIRHDSQSVLGKPKFNRRPGNRLPVFRSSITEIAVR